jgi:hypothetical protein
MFFGSSVLFDLVFVESVIVLLAIGIAVQSVPINGREMEHHGCGMAGSDQDSSCAGNSCISITYNLILSHYVYIVAGNTSDFPSSWILITAVTGGVVVVGVIVVVIICCRKGRSMVLLNT